MPNWIEGTLKVRGSLENVKKFIFEGLNVYQMSADEPLPKDQWMLITDSREYKYYEIDFDYEAYVEGTKRAFVRSHENHSVFYTQDDWSDPVIAVFAARQAWSFKDEEWREISEKYGVDIRLFGFEQGMEFGQEIEIINGEVTIDKTIEYKDWDWECPFPYMGG